MKIENVYKRSHYAKNVLFKNDVAAEKTVDKMTGFINDVLYKHNVVLTDFLNPGERDILKSVAGDDVSLLEFGGYNSAEKKRVLLDNSNLEFSPAAFQITVFAIEYSQKFATLTHSAILGSLANSGVETSTFGDIITDGAGHWQFFAKSELSDFFTSEINYIGHTKVRLRPTTKQKVLTVEDDSAQATAIASSLRLDALVAAITKKSRQQSKNDIANNLVKLNWHSATNFNIMIKEDDVLSIRHFGRIKILDIKATRKGKFKVVYKLWQTKRKKSKD